MPTYMTETERQEARARLNNWLILTLGAFGLLFIRFGILQVVQHKIWSFIAENNQIRKITVPAMRGNIYDRNRHLLADWRQSFNVTVIPKDLTEPALFKLAEILKVSPEEIRARMKKNQSWSPFISVLVAQDLSWEEFAQVEENRLVMPGVNTEIRPVRKYYPDSMLVSHVLGYMSEITREELDNPDYQGYRMGDRVGRSGMERALEKTIRGRDGVTYKLVDAMGRELGSESIAEDLRSRMDYAEKLKTLEAMSQPVEPGQSAVLTLDLDFQRIVRDNFGNYDGSVVVMDVKTGELLVLFSTPGYDPSLFVGQVSPEVWMDLTESPRHPLLNRALQGTYPPGSVFKIIMATGALEDHLVNYNTTFICRGSYSLKNLEFHCWNRLGHGPMAIEDAIIESCDVYFYNLGAIMGVRKIAEWARKFGLGAPTGELLPEEKAGLVPDPDWKWRVKRKKWVQGETINFAIGQGYLLTTPLQAVLIPAAAANNGRLMKPQLIHHFEDIQGSPISVYNPQVLAERLMSPETARFLRRAMTRVVEEPRGTAYRYVKSSFIRMAGKTGTSEVSKKYQGRSLEETPIEYRDHAWFVAFAPVEEPEIAMAVIVEHGGGGGAVAGSIAKKILEQYYLYRSAGIIKPGTGG